MRVLAGPQSRRLDAPHQRARRGRRGAGRPHRDGDRAARRRGAAARARACTRQAIKDAAWSPGRRPARARLARRQRRRCSTCDARRGARCAASSSASGAYAVDWSCDGRRSRSASRTARSSCATPSAGRLVARYHDHEEPVYAVAFRPDGARSRERGPRRAGGAAQRKRLPLARGPRGHGGLARLVAGRESARLGLARRHDPALGCAAASEQAVLRGHRLTVWGLAVTPDGARLLSRPLSTTTCASGADGCLRARAHGPHAAGGRRRRARRDTARSRARATGPVGSGTSTAASRACCVRTRSRSPRRRDEPRSSRAGGYAARAPMQVAVPAASRWGRSRWRSRRARKLTGALGRAAARASGATRCCAAIRSAACAGCSRCAYAEVPLYREKLDAARVHPRDFRRLDDLRRFPIVEKDELRDALPGGALRRGHRPRALPHPADFGLVRSLHGDRALAALRRRAQPLQPAHLRLARLPLVAHAPPTCSRTGCPSRTTSASTGTPGSTRSSRPTR